MKHKWLLLIPVCFCGSVFARIGETPAQCIKRYGVPSYSTVGRSTNADANASYTTNGMEILVLFRNGKAETVNYRRIRNEDHAQSGKMSETQINILLAANTVASNPFVSADATPGKQLWQTTDGALIAFYDNRTFHLVVFTRVSQNRMIMENANKEADELKGF